MMKSLLLVVIFISFLCQGCTSLSLDPRDVARIHDEGFASIQPSGSERSRVLQRALIDRYFVTAVDAPAAEGKSMSKLYRLAPGNRRVTVSVFLQDYPNYQLVERMGSATLEFEAKAGKSYRVEGARIKFDSANIWITDISTGEKVASADGVLLSARVWEVKIYYY